VDTGICSREAFEAKRSYFLTKIDLWTAEDHAKILDGLGTGVRKLLDQCDTPL
jgi:hypothetical protein